MTTKSAVMVPREKQINKQLLCSAMNAVLGIKNNIAGRGSHVRRGEPLALLQNPTKAGVSPSPQKHRAAPLRGTPPCCQHQHLHHHSILNPHSGLGVAPADCISRSGHRSLVRLVSYNTLHSRGERAMALPKPELQNAP